MRGAGGQKRTGHTGPTLRPLIPYHNDRLLPLLDLSPFKRADEIVLGVVYFRFADEAHAFFARDLADATTWREAPSQNLDMACFLDGVG